MKKVGRLIECLLEFPQGSPFFFSFDSNRGSESTYLAHNFWITKTVKIIVLKGESGDYTTFENINTEKKVCLKVTR